MSAYLHDSIVSAQESQALKEMIFNRARERAAALAGDVHETYTSSMQSEIMDIARDSFRATKNPFSINTAEQEIVSEKEVVKVKPQQAPQHYQEGLGFSQKNVEAIKSQINFRNKVVIEKVAQDTITENMNDAREDFIKKPSFIGALDFLNSQATISLVKSKGKSFDAIA